MGLPSAYAAYVHQQDQMRHTMNIERHSTGGGEPTTSNEMNKPSEPLPAAPCSASPDNVEILSIKSGEEYGVNVRVVSYRTTDGNPPHPDSRAVQDGILCVPKEGTSVVYSQIGEEPIPQGLLDLLGIDEREVLRFPKQKNSHTESETQPCDHESLSH